MVDVIVVVGAVVALAAVWFFFLRSAPKKPAPKRPNRGLDNMMLKFDKTKYGGKEEWTWAEVEQHNKEGDCWLVVDGEVYDVTTFVPRHPGGAAIFKNAGKDNTVGFKGPQHGPSAFEQILEFKIGRVVGDKKSD